MTVPLDRQTASSAAYRDAVRLAKLGHPPAKIEAITGTSRTTIYSYLSYARARGEAIPLFSTTGNHSGRPRVVLTDAQCEQLGPHADRRSMGIRELASLLLLTAVECDLVDAILDDGDASD
ncbi:hypothetical protein [Pseudoruegeria sp. HB172150]|uniref:hypothetical protein n=1 Tax=Pseudoruegeria sp. HB172150 TaxID=2721164 RepID=UPI001557C19B|nr:hypothetical protein [Pseudoruegeria sp. HB172150]